MKVGDIHYRTIWIEEKTPEVVKAIDQRQLPYRFDVVELRTLEDFERAIRDMWVRGAGLIGAAAGYGMYIASLHAVEESFDADMLKAAGRLKATRPTAKNLEWAVDRQLRALEARSSVAEKRKAALETAEAIADEDAEACRRIGRHGFPLIEEISAAKKGAPVNILTHCNAGWLAFVDCGTATAPIYEAAGNGINVHVWVDETRPRNQGARLTAWELASHGIPHHVIADNTGGHLMREGMVDMVIVGSDRTTRSGDVANKIGTYLKALAAYDNRIPFYVALPSSTFDWDLDNGMDIPIEQRDQDEVRYISGLHAGDVRKVLLCPGSSPAVNYAFDVTPARLVTGLITERGICKASGDGIASLFPEYY